MISTSLFQLKIKDGLDELRNKSVFAFFIVDMLMIAFILALKMSADYGLEDGIMIKYTCSIDGNAQEHSIDPIGFAFIAVFGLLMVVQVGMEYFCKQLLSMCSREISTTIVNMEFAVVNLSDIYVIYVNNYM